jgi:hypothetical protein
MKNNPRTTPEFSKKTHTQTTCTKQARTSNGSRTYVKGRGKNYKKTLPLTVVEELGTGDKIAL